MNRAEVQRRLGEEILRILAETAVAPVMEEGRVVGVQVTRLPEGSLLTDAGLRTGDVLTRINDTDIDGMATLIGLWPRLQSASELRAVVRRNGQTFSLLVSLRNPPHRGDHGLRDRLHPRRPAAGPHDRGGDRPHLPDLDLRPGGAGAAQGLRVHARTHNLTRRTLEKNLRRSRAGRTRTASPPAWPRSRRCSPWSSAGQRVVVSDNVVTGHPPPLHRRSSPTTG